MDGSTLVWLCYVVNGVACRADQTPSKPKYGKRNAALIQVSSMLLSYLVAALCVFA